MSESLSCPAAVWDCKYGIWNHILSQSRLDRMISHDQRVGVGMPVCDDLKHTIATWK